MSHLSNPIVASGCHWCWSFVLSVRRFNRHAHKDLLHLSPQGRAESSLFSSLCLCLSLCVRERQRCSVSCLSSIFCGLFFVLHFSGRAAESTASVPLSTVISAQDLQWNLELNMPLPEDKFTLALSVLGNDSLKRWKLHSTPLAQPSTGGGFMSLGLLCHYMPWQKYSEY